MNSIDKLIGQRMRELRRALDLSQTQLGEQVGITFQQIGKYESGENRVSAGRLHAISKVLNTSIASFFSTSQLEACRMHDENGSTGKAMEDLERLIAAFEKIESEPLRRAILDTAEAAAVLEKTGIRSR